MFANIEFLLNFHKFIFAQQVRSVIVPCDLKMICTPIHNYSVFSESVVILLEKPMNIFKGINTKSCLNLVQRLYSGF